MASPQICLPATPQPTWLRPFKPGPRSRLALSQRYLLPFQTRHQPSRLGIIPQTNNKGCTGRLYLTGKHDRRYLRGTFHTPSPDIKLNSQRQKRSSGEMQIDCPPASPLNTTQNFGRKKHTNSRVFGRKKGEMFKYHSDRYLI